MCALTPELLDMSINTCKIGIASGVVTSIGASALKFWGKIQSDETTAEMETEFNKLKESILSHNKNPINSNEQIVVPYLADPSLSERLAQIEQSKSVASNNLSNVPSNIAIAGIFLEALKTFKDIRKN
jgi:hypothetical protein